MILNKNLICTKCKKSFLVKSTKTSNFSSAECSCSTYPIIEDILYYNLLTNDKLKNDLENNYSRTVAKLLSFSISSKIFFYLTLRFKHFYKAAGYSKFIRLLSCFGFSQGWQRYLLNREKIPSFFLHLFSLDLIKNKKQQILDLGCGMGNLLPFYYDRVKPDRIIAVDKSFLNLFIARIFFAQSNTTLICTDINKHLPIKNFSLSLIYIVDSLHYLINKKKLMKIFSKLLVKFGTLAIIHTLNINTPKDNSAHSIKPKSIKTILSKFFNQQIIISNKKMWKKFKEGKNLELTNDNTSDKSYAYNVIASKKILPKFLLFPKKYTELIKKTKINYYQDPAIIKTQVYE